MAAKKQSKGKNKGKGKEEETEVEKKKAKKKIKQPAAGPRKVGCLMLFAGDFVGKGKDDEYWRRRLGWFGEENPRAVYFRYEASGDPTRTGGLVPDGRFKWVLESGEWMPKETWLEVKEEIAAERRNAGRPRGRGRGRGRGGRGGVGPCRRSERKGAGRPARKE